MKHPNLLDTPSVHAFLDAADSVLNSNTFLLWAGAIDPEEGSPDAAIRQFLSSERFRHQVQEQDAARGWHNLWEMDQTGTYHLRQPDAPMVRPDFQLVYTPLDAAAGKAYLLSMLATTSGKGPFSSPYGGSLPETEASRLVDAFLQTLMDGQSWHLLQLDPRFGYSSEEQETPEDGGAEAICGYFEGRASGDSASLLVREDGAAWLLLTNGAP